MKRIDGFSLFLLVGVYRSRGTPQGTTFFTRGRAPLVAVEIPAFRDEEQELADIISNDFMNHLKNNTGDKIS